MEEYNNWKESFENLSSNEQIVILQDFLEVVKNQLNVNNPEGNIDAIDIAFNRLDGNQIVFDVTLVDKSTGKYFHEFYTDDFDKININAGKLNETYKSMKVMGNYDLTAMEKQISNLEGKQIDNLEKLQDNENKISLSKLKELNKEVEDSANSLGISKDDVLSYASFDANHNLQINEKAIKGSGFQDIDATEKVSVNYNMRDVLGGNFVKYKIIKTTNGNYKLFGIDAEGNAKEFTQDQVELISDSKAITLTQDNGNAMQSNMVVGFRIKDKVSSVNSDQIVGLCTDETSRLTCFYGRGANTDNIIAENIPSSIYNGPKEKYRFFDTKINSNEELVKYNDIINEVAKEQGIDPDELKEVCQEELLTNFRDNLDKASDEQIRATITDIAFDISRSGPTQPLERTLNQNPHP